MLINLPSRGLDLLLKLTNASLVHGLPSCLKTAIITMIPKKESSSPLPSDYRPISLTSCVGKFIERIVRNRLYKFLEEKKLIIKEQSGFRSKRGTADNLVFITQKIQECINREKKVCGIFFDISKAFDRAWHYGIVFKLVKIGAPIYLVRFVKYFLSDRSFRVLINEFITIIFLIFCGVPQGSVLGPLLFLACIMDIPLASAQSLSYSALFADDLCCIFIFTKSTVAVQKRMREYLESLVDWLFKWRLKMNVTKCCYTIFSRGGRNGINFDLQMNGKSIPYAPNPTFLGITFDVRLTFKAHVENLRIRALKRLNIIKIFSHKSWHLNKTTLTNIYRALMGSIFDYSFFIVSCCSNLCLDRIQTTQNRAIRCIYRLKWDSPTDQLFPLSGVLPLRARFLQLGARYLLKSLLFKNPFTALLISEYKRSFSEITKKYKLSTPLCYFISVMGLVYCFLVVLVLNILKFRLTMIDLLSW